MKTRTRPFLTTIVAAAALLLAGLAFAQDATMIATAEHETLGTYLTDAEGRSLYLFVNETAEATDPETMTEGVRANAAACEGGCLENWPPVEASAVEAGEGLNPDLLYTADVGGTMMAVYNGWPLYYFANDAAPGETNGQGLGEGNMWYLVNPEGMAVEGTADEGAMDDAEEEPAEEEPADNGAADDGAADDGAADDGAADDGGMDGEEEDAADDDPQ